MTIQFDRSEYSPNAFECWKMEFAGRIRIEQMVPVTSAFKTYHGIITNCRDFVTNLENGGEVGSILVRNGRGALKKWATANGRFLRDANNKLVPSSYDYCTQVNFFICGIGGILGKCAAISTDEILVEGIKDREIRRGLYGHPRLVIENAIRVAGGDPSCDCGLLFARRSFEELRVSATELSNRLRLVSERGGDFVELAKNSNFLSASALRLAMDAQGISCIKCKNLRNDAN